MYRFMVLHCSAIRNPDVRHATLSSKGISYQPGLTGRWRLVNQAGESGR